MYKRELIGQNRGVITVDNGHKQEIKGHIYNPFALLRDDPMR